MRGLDYYTRTAFEFQPKVEGAQSTLGGGGRYDGLMEQLGGRPTPAIGFGTGLERIILNLKRQELEVGAGRRPDAFIAVADEAAAGKAMQLAHELRVAGLTAVLGSPGRSLKAQMRLASSIDGGMPRSSARRSWRRAAA